MKVVSALLFDLPPTRRYRVIFMTRELDEILASQREMLRRRGVADAGPDDALMRRHFENHLARARRFVESAAHIETLWCSYNDLLREPPAAVARVADFLGGELERERMVAAVDPGLYRQRGKAAR